MRLRLNTLTDESFPKASAIKKTLFFLMLISFCPVFSQNDVNAIKKEANKRFDEEEYIKAYKLYSQLVANYPKDPEYNYKLGVCMIYAEPDKKKCLPYLTFATRNMTDEIKDVTFWLGKAYHINYLFDEAIKNYEAFKSSASAARQRKLQVDREIAACNNGKKLLSNLSDLVILSKRELNEADYFRSYDLRSIGGKLLVKPEEFKSPADKKKKESSIVYLPANSNQVFYSSYGDDPQNGRDIYVSTKQGDGSYSKGEKIKGINTPYDEDFPFLHPNGQVLYFASKGHNSMGGYDIFQSNWNEASASWGEPVNLEFPINSPDDDYLFVTDSLEKTAFFSTGRQSAPGKIHVLKINTERRPIDVLVIRGNVLKGTNDQNRNSVISVKRANGEGITRTYNANGDGDYELEVPNGEKLLFTVETPGQKTQSQEVELPLANSSRPLRQTISYEQRQLKISNYFDEAPKDDDYLQYLKVIEKKAKLDVSDSAAVAGSTQVATNTKKSRDSSSPQLVDQSAPEAAATGTASKGMDNKGLAAIAKQDAKESMDEANKLKQDARDALEVGRQKQEEAAAKMITADEQLKAAEALSGEQEKKTALDKANALKQEAEADAAVAKKILDFGKSLEEDAALQEQEAQLNDVYARELETAITKKNGTDETQKKLSELQQQLSELNGRKNKSEALYTSLSSEIDEKEKRLAMLSQANADTRLSMGEISTAIGENDTQLEKTRKKKDKEALIQQNEELKVELTEKQTLVGRNEEEMRQISTELESLKNELSLATKIKTETIVTATPSVAVTNTKTAGPAKAPVKTPAVAAGNKKQPAGAKSTSVTAGANAKQPQAADYTPLAAASATEAVTRLERLDTQLSNSVANDRELFDFNGYQSAQAQSLKVEADAGINEASLQQKQLKETIADTKKEINSPSAVPTQATTPASLSKEGDDLAVKAQSLRTQAENKSGEEKTKLLEEATTTDGQANEKYLQAANLTGSDNKAVFETNSGNIAKLSASDKVPEADKATAKRLSEEAAISFKQALAIREEAAALASTGAKLGSMSNAEEIEGAALAKQQSALTLLRKYDAELVLDQPVTSGNAGVAAATPEVVSGELQKVNNGLNQLADSKLQSYRKLYEANAAEIEYNKASIIANQAALDGAPGIKSEYAAVEGKLQSVAEMKAQSDAASASGEQLNLLGAAVKRQIEVIRQLAKINTALTKIAEKNATTTPPQPPLAAGGNSIVTTDTAPDTSARSTSTPQPEVANTASLSATSDKAITPDAELQVIDPASLSGTDTTAEQLMSWLDKSTTQLRNKAAENTMRQSLNAIRATNSEISLIDEKLANFKPDENNTPSDNGKEPSAQLRSRSDALLVEAETLSGKAFAAKKEAEGKSGAEADSLLAEAARQEQSAQSKKLEASELVLQANARDYDEQAAVITRLLAKLNAEDPAKAEELRNKQNEAEALHKQTSQLRDEATRMDNLPARLGALSNAEEKEAEIAQVQAQLVKELTQRYPGEAVKTAETPETLNARKNQLLEKQYAELTNLANSFSLDYETAKSAVPSDLNAAQQQVKDNAEALSAESKKLLIRAAQENNSSEKLKLLNLAVKTGNTALGQLNKVTPTKTGPRTETKRDEAALNTIGQNLANATAGNNRPARNPQPRKPKAVATPSAAAATTARGTVRVEGLEVLRGNAYTNERPIPIDAPVADGLVFRVQIGAFKTRLANDAFRGLSPLNGETTNSGYIRYTAGNFNKVENANAVKNDLRRLGYSDAFVVVYYNGKRISLSEALEIMSKEGKTIDANAPASAGITAGANIPKAPAPVATVPAAQEVSVVSQPLEKTNGLLYTIQIGVYTKEVTNNRLLNLRPIFTERLNNGLFRYTAGIYNNAERLVADKNKVVLLGVRDAFVSAYVNGKRIPFSEGRQRQAQDSSVKLEAERPIVFPEQGGPAPTTETLNPPPAVTNTLQPFKNSVSTYPAATDSNGVKENEDGITFKVQIGAYSREVPGDVAARFSSITTWPVENKQVNGLVIYNIGNFSEPRFAKALKDEAVKLGITDAFITVYRNGSKLYGTEAASLLAR